MGQLGTLLTRAREARGLTIEDAERDTRISKRYLAALEDEEFEVIPAPVYARGFLRSYSQYLGLDPKEALSLFPRDDDGMQESSSQRPTNQNPVSAVGASRPAWKKTAPPRDTPRERPDPAQRRDARPAANDPGWEPTIGIDIGVPVPSRRIRTDPAAQTRTAAVAIVAVGAILAVIVLAFVISKMGGGDGNGGLGDDGTGTEPTATTGTTPEATQDTGTTTLGTVPSVVGMTQEEAETVIEESGFTTTVIREPNIAPEGQVVDQGPVAGSALSPGGTVIITVSEGP